MTKVKITLVNRKEIIIPSISCSDIYRALEHQHYYSNQRQLLNFSSGHIVCIQDISSIEDIEDDNSNCILE